MADLTGRVVVITGASSGIGAAAALELARRGARLVLGARRMDKLEVVAQACHRAGGEAAAVPCDVARRADVDGLVEAAVDRFGRIDVMFANAGYGFLNRIQEVTDAQFDEIVATNVRGTLYAMQAAAAIMLKQPPLPGAPARARQGHIILTSSGAARRGLPLYGIYAMTKAAQLSLAEAMRVELRGRGVYVSTVHPLTTATEFFDVASSRSKVRSLGLGHAQPVEVVARKVAALIGHPRPELWPVPGSRWLLAVATLWPSLADWAMSRTIHRRTRTK